MVKTVNEGDVRILVSDALKTAQSLCSCHNLDVSCVNVYVNTIYIKLDRLDSFDNLQQQKEFFMAVQDYLQARTNKMIGKSIRFSEFSVVFKPEPKDKDDSSRKIFDIAISCDYQINMS